MKNKIVLFFCFLFFPTVLFAKLERLTQEESQVVLDWLTTEMSKINSVNGRFTEVTKYKGRTLNRRGLWSFRKPQEVKWKYVVQKAKVNRETIAKINRFRESFVPVMQACMTGRIFNAPSYFEYAIHRSDDGIYVVVLRPKKGLLVELYSHLLFCFSTQHRIPQWIELRGQQGGVRRIRLYSA